MVEYEGMLEVAGVVERLSLGEDGFHEVLVVAKDLKLVPGGKQTCFKISGSLGKVAFLSLLCL